MPVIWPLASYSTNQKRTMRQENIPACCQLPTKLPTRTGTPCLGTRAEPLGLGRQRRLPLFRLSPFLFSRGDKENLSRRLQHARVAETIKSLLVLVFSRDHLPLEAASGSFADTDARVAITWNSKRRAAHSRIRMRESRSPGTRSGERRRTPGRPGWLPGLPGWACDQYETGRELSTMKHQTYKDMRQGEKIRRYETRREKMWK